MMDISIRSGNTFGVPFVKFTLTYDGELRANDDYKRKWEIRKQFHPQMQELWRVNPALQWLKRHRYVPRDGGWIIDRHHSQDHTAPVQNPALAETSVDLIAEIERGGKRFLPLIREELALKCALKILFLRKEEPGRVYQGGDIDNRLKTLFDAFQVPDTQQVVQDNSYSDPLCCLLDDDGLIQRVEVDTGRLLLRPDTSQHEVRLIIEVDVRVTQARFYNQPFLGD